MDLSWYLTFIMIRGGVNRSFENIGAKAPNDHGKQNQYKNQDEDVVGFEK